MTRFDPTLDRADFEARTLAGEAAQLLSQDILAALDGITGGAEMVGALALEPAARLQIDRIGASAELLRTYVVQALEGPPDAPAAVPEPTDVDRLLATLRHRFAGEAQARGRSFRIRLDPAMPRQLRLDHVLLCRCLARLVADRLGREGGSIVTLAVALEPKRIVFRVGEAEVAPAGAEPIPESVRGLAARLGAGLEVLRRDDGGLDGLLVFEAAVGLDDTPERRARLPDLAGLRILLAEDNPTNQMVASNMLRALNAEVLVCADGVEALERFETFPADLLVVDIEMPRLTGLDVIRAVRGRSDARALVPIVALTAYALREHRERIIAAGADGLIAKPITSVEAFGRALAVHVRAGAPQPGRADPEPLADTVPVIDTAVFDGLCRTIGADLVGELMEKVVADLIEARGRLAVALAPLDREQIERASHILISVAGAFGAVRLQATSRLLNQDAHAATTAPATLATGVARCLAEIDAAATFARGHAGG